MWHTKSIIFSSLILSLAACGGSDNNNSDTGNTNPTPDPDPNPPTTEQQFAADLAYVATESSKLTIEKEQSGTVPIAANISSLPFIETIKNDLSNAKPSTFGTLPVGPVVTETETEAGNCGGQKVTTTTSTTPDNASTFYPISTSASVNFQDFCESDNNSTITWNGSLLYDISLTSTSEYSFTYEYNFVYSGTVNGFPVSGRYIETESCVTINNVENCTTSTPFTSNSGISYNLNNLNVSGNNNSGYQISGTLSDQDGNDYGILVSNLTQQCANNNVSTGTIEITLSNGEVISVTFPNCNDCVVTYQGVSNTYPQDSAES